MPIEPKIFKAYDVRGKYPEELNEEAAFEIAAAVGKHFGPRAKIVVGRDGRLSSPSLYKAVIRGLANNELGIRNEVLGIRGKKKNSIIHNSKFIIHKAGLITTPMLYFLVNKLKADGGIMVTASHNPKEYNGLKVVGKNARPMSGLEIYSILRKYENIRNYENGNKKNSYFSNISYVRNYVDFLKKFLKPKRKLKVVFDCSNGTTGRILRQLTTNDKRLTAVIINDKPDGNFPGHGPNPLAEGATRQLEREVKKHQADLGVIFDADGDRVFFLDNRGRWIDPNETAYILTRLFRPPYVTGIVSSWRLKGDKAFVSRVGHYFFKKLMREKKASLGLEHSGHYYFKYFFYCDSGIFAAIQIMNFVSGLKTDLASWLDALSLYHRSGELNFKVEDKEKILEKVERLFKKSAKKIIKMDGLTMEFSDYWFNLRPSNTENLLRLNMEATDKNILKRELQNLKRLIIL